MELQALPARERAAAGQAIAKLAALGPALGYPHQSAILGSSGVRELRPRRGRSRWRLLYRRSGNAYLVAAIAPEARVNRLGFRRAVAIAESRLRLPEAFA